MKLRYSHRAMCSYLEKEIIKQDHHEICRMYKQLKLDPVSNNLNFSKGITFDPTINFASAY